MAVSALVMILSVAIPSVPVSPYPLTAVAEPSQPSDIDLVSITLSGRWGTPLVPDQVRYERVGDTISIDAGGASFDSAPAVVTPWALTTQLGTLPAGTYQVFGLGLRVGSDVSHESI
jgi:hypothetical protein